MNAPISNPYVGPRPFQKEEAKRFFGREREARDLLALVSSQRLVLFYASSGAGKSSLINARLIDALVGRSFEVLPVGRISGVLPRETGADLSGANIFGYFLKQSLAEHCLDATLTEADRQFFQEYASAPLSDFLLRLALTGQDEDGNDRYIFTNPDAANGVTAPVLPGDAEVELRPRALIIDQFEEIFTTNLQAWEQRGDFFSQLRQAMEDDPYLWVVLAMREDFIANLDPLAHLLPGELHARYYMQRMGHDAALDAVKKPVETDEPPEWHRPFAPGVAEKLVDNLRQVHITTEAGEGVANATGEFIEPVQLQVVCYQLWEQLRDTPGTEITDADLDRLAGGQDLSVFIDRALGEFYEQALRRVLEQAGNLAGEMELRRWFSERLITEAGTRGFVYRGESETGGLPNEVVRLLAAEFLIRSESRAGGTWYELSHDRFVEPIQRSNQRWSLEQLQRNPLLRRAHEWAASHSDPAQRDASFLLSDDELRNLDLGGQAPEPVVHDFVEASQRAGEQRALLATQRQLEEAKQREEMEKRISRRLRLLAALAAIMAISAFVAWFLVFRQAGILRDRNAELTNTNIALVDAKAAAETSAATEKAAKEQAETANQLAQSLTLASQSLESSSIKDALLLAHAATTAYSTTLQTKTALLAALDASYRLDDGTMTAYVPPEWLDFAAEGPWEAVAFSGDGRLLALSDQEGGISFFDNTSREPIGLRQSNHGSYPVYALAFDPTGPRLASATGDRNNPTAPRHDLLLWDLTNPEAPNHTVLAAGQPSIWSAAWSPDGQRLAVGNQNGTVNLWNLSGTEPISRTLPGRHADWAVSVAFDNEGSRLASAGRDGKIILWSELSSRTPVSQTLADHTAWVNDIAFSPDGAQLASGSDDGTLRLWNLTEELPSSAVLDNRYDQGAEPWSLVFGPESSRLLAAGWRDGILRVYDLERSDAKPWQLAGHTGEVNNLAFDPAAAQRLVSLGAGDYEPIAWDLSQRSEFATMQPFSTPMTATLHAFSPDGRWLAVVSTGGAVSVSETAMSSPAITFTAGMTVTAAALSDAGSQLALAGCEEVLREAAPQAPAPQSALPLAPPDLSVPTAATPSPTPKPTQPIASAGEKLGRCKLTLWSLGSAPPISPSLTITSTQPIRALTFHPQRTGEVAVGMESGEIQGRDLATSAPVNLLPRVPEIVDLAFSSDGRWLAALGKSGLVKIWNWSSRELVEEFSLLEQEEGKQYDAIEFLHDDAWLAIGSSAPQLELWEWETWTTVLKLGLDAARTADIVFEPTQQTLIAVRPDGLLRWPMDQAAWLELACTRAERNLSYQAWRVAFPAEERDDTASALVCPAFPLDVSFAEALVREAEKAIDDCTPSQVAEGMDILRRASRLVVYPALKLDPAAYALDVLSNQAWENLQQPSRAYGELAEACLQRAADQIGEAGWPAFDPQQALQAGQRLVQAEALLADPQLTDAGLVVDSMEEALALSAQWPNRLLEDRALRLLPQAYYRLCQQGDEVGCQRLPTVMDLMAYGDTVAGVVKAGVEEPQYFLGQRGQAVTIAMNAVNNGFDTLVRLEGPEGALTTNDDNGIDNNSLIADYLLPRDSVYRIIPTAYSGEGSYRLSLDVSSPRPIAPGAAVTSTTAQDSLWQFTGQAGQLVALALDGHDMNFDPFLRLIGPDFTTLKENFDSGGGGHALIVATLPADGPYFVETGPVGGNVPYTLRLLEPQPLPFDQPQVSATPANTLWVFDGARSQVIDLTVTPDGGGPQPQLTLRSVAGDPLAEGVASLATGAARIPAHVLSNDGRFIVQVGPADNRTPYTLTLTSLTPRPLSLGEPVTSSTQADPLWTFSGAAGEIVDITLNSARLTFDPVLSLLDAYGSEVASDNDGGGNLNARIPAFVLPDDGQYFIRPLPAGSPVSYTLALAQVAPQVIIAGETVTSTLRQDTLWAFDGTAGQPINATVTSGAGDSPSLALLDGAGQTLRYAESSPIAGYLLPRAGRYYLQAGNLNQATRYTLALQVVQAPEIKFGESKASNTQTNELWRFTGEEGQVIDITMSGWVSGGFDPYLTLLGPDGATLAENDDISSGDPLDYNARIAGFRLPQSGEYFIRTGRPGSQAPYTLSLQALQVPAIEFGETKTSDTQTYELWRFTGQAGQTVDITLSGWTSGSFDPYLTLLGPDGNRLAENDDISSPDNLNAQIARFLLPQSGDYFIRAGRPGSTAPYHLTLNVQDATPFVPGSLVQVTRDTAYSLPVAQPGLVQISTDQPAALTLVGPGGALLAGQALAILRRLDASGTYTVAVGFPSGSPPRMLSVAPVQATPRPMNTPGDNQGRLRTGGADLWTFAGDDQRALRFTAQAASFTPLLELWAPDGALLATGDRNGRLISALPVAGDYLLSVRAGDMRASGPYTITVEPAGALPGPEACDWHSEAGDYAPVRMGSTVILGRHRPVNGDAAWDSAMAAYVGRPARVTDLVGADGQGCPTVLVDIDEGNFLWRVRDVVVVE